MLNRSDKLRLLAAVLTLPLLMPCPARAVATSESVTASINKAKVLAPGTQIKVRVQGEQALISTFRNERADDKDSKIDALLLGKTVFEIPASGITSLVVYFYNSKTPNEYKSVTIRISDVKAFDAGTMSQDEMLSSIEIKPGKIQDTAMAIESRMMLSAAARRDFQTVDRGEEIEVSCKMPALSDEEYKLEAYRIATMALEVAGDKSVAKRIVVTFFDPFEKGKFRQARISLNNVQTIQRQLGSAFGALQVNSGVSRLTTKDIEPAEGPMLPERTALLRRIQALEDKGVGVAPFLQAYQGLDAKVSSADAASLAPEITRLGASLGEQEKRYENAKSFKVSRGDDGKPTSDSTAVVTPVTAKEPPPRGAISRWVLGFFPLDTSSIVKDPDRYLAECKAKLEAATKKRAEDDKRYAAALLWFAEVLAFNNQPEQAKKFDTEGRALSARFKK